MDKQKLRKLRTLNATKEMMKKANEDTPQIISHKYTWRGRDEIRYKYGIYMRCQQLRGYLKVAFFLVESMRLGNNKPAYELFINKETGEFLTWDRKLQKWRDAKLDRLDWPVYTWNSGRYINPEGYRSIKSYLGTERGGYEGILEYQFQVRKDQLKERHRRETSPWDLEMDRVPELPKDWDHWIDKTGITQNFIFYDYQRKGATVGYCTWCEKVVPIKEPRHNQYGTCKCCKRKIQYKARGKAGNFNTDEESVYLLQKCEEEILVREFEVQRRYTKGQYETPYIHKEEIGRTFFDKDLYERVYYWGLYRNDYHRWIKGEWGYGRYYYGGVKGRIYKRTLSSLKEQLRKTGLIEMLQKMEKLDPVQYLRGVRQNPELERIAKAGLARLVLEELDHYDSLLKESRERELHKRLGIDKARMKRLREANGGRRFLQWLKYEKAIDTIIPDEVLRYFSQENIVPKDIEKMKRYMSEKKICNYLKRQQDITGRRANALIQTWEDYICIASRLKMDVTKELFYKPKNLKEAHDKVVSICGGADVARRAGEIAGKFPDIENICQEIKEKYQFAEKKYSIIVPEKIEDIIIEGQTLGHCLHSSDRYFDRIQTRESYIVFLRKTEQLDTPYYTMEIEPDGTTRQKRTVGDNQNEDFEDAKNFIRRWQKEVQKRLTREDQQMAAVSKELRIQEFEELRRDKKKVWYGKLAGKLLVDVLEADLMEAEAAAAG